MLHYVEKENFSGYDPYDALNSPIARMLSFNLKYGRIFWIQLLRRLPVNIRPLLFMEKGHNPKGVGLFLGAYAKLSHVWKEHDFSCSIDVLMHLLAVSKSHGYSGNSWGYNFNWQSRAFYLPKYTPTIVNSSFIGHALLDAYEILGSQRFLDMAVPIKDFILNDLNRTREGDSFCFSYSPHDKTAVHNANLLGASLLFRLYEQTGDPILKDAAFSSLAYSMKYQHEDGSWYYAEAEIQRWKDSFHTGFNLQSIRYFLKEEESEFSRAYSKGVEFYLKNFFLEDGTPKYYHNRVYPIDIHSPAEAIYFLSGELANENGLLEKIINWTFDNMLDKNGYFYFRTNRNYSSKIPYMRWSQAWMMHALSEYLYRGYLSGNTQ